MTFNDNARVDSSRVQRRRGGGVGGKVAAGGGIGGAGLLIVLFLASQWLGVDLTGLASGVPSPTSQVAADERVSFDSCRTGQDANADDECRMAAAALSLDDYWAEQMDGYREPAVVLYRGATQSACGTASNQVGPFYCPPDQGIYIDTEFYGLLRSQLGGSDDALAQMYVLAHEWGHHIQHLTGDLERADRSAGADGGQVRLELQADCYAGAWVGAASSTEDSQGTPFLKPVSQEELNDALSAAAAVGDDHIQQQAGQRVNPDGFTHGSSEQRQRWFKNGQEYGAGACDTFSVPAERL